MNFKNLIFILLLITGPMALIAQDNATSEETDEVISPFMKYKHDLGFSLGLVTGQGLSYRHWFNSSKLGNFGVQVTFNPNLTEHYNIYEGGLAFIYRLTDSQYTSLFLYQSNSLNYLKHKSSSLRPNNSDDQIYRSFSNGLGIGLEVVALKRLSINVMTGYHIENIQEGSEGFKTLFGMKGEIGVFYKF